MRDKDTHDGDVSFIRALAELLRENDLTELQVKREYAENDSLNVRVARGGVAVAAPAGLPPPATQMPLPATSAAPASAPTDPAQLPGAVTSPMVGTAYLQSEPGAAPFVKVGQIVKTGDTLLIIEAMKTMNQIPAPHGGEVKRILVEDGAPVEYGAALMVIE